TSRCLPPSAAACAWCARISWSVNFASTARDSCRAGARIDSRRAARPGKSRYGRANLSIATRTCATPALCCNGQFNVMPHIATKTIRCSGELPAFLALPNTQKKSPAIVLMHERYGLVQHTRDLAQRFARDGFVCIAPDFFHKHPDQEALHRGAVGYDMTDPEGVLYLKAAVSELSRLSQVESDKIAVMGVCQTGRHPLVLAAERTVAAALVWYGAASKREWETSQRYPRPLDEIIARVDCPVLGIFGEADHVISL